MKRAGSCGWQSHGSSTFVLGVLFLFLKRIIPSVCVRSLEQSWRLFGPADTSVCSPNGPCDRHMPARGPAPRPLGGEARRASGASGEGGARSRRTLTPALRSLSPPDPPYAVSGTNELLVVVNYWQIITYIFPPFFGATFIRKKNANLCVSHSCLVTVPSLIPPVFNRIGDLSISKFRRYSDKVKALFWCKIMFSVHLVHVLVDFYTMDDIFKENSA